MANHLARAHPALSSSAPPWGSSVLCRVARRVRGWQDEPTGVLGHLADLRDVPELRRLAEFALADRPRVGIADRYQPVGDLQPTNAPLDAYIAQHAAAAAAELPTSTLKTF